MKSLPTKFESILRSDTLNFSPLIVKVDDDLVKFRTLVRFNTAQEAGSLAVVCNPPGQGKTTAAYAATVLLKDHFLPVKSVPPPLSLPLRSIPAWLAENLPDRGNRTTLILIDGRESSDDEQGLRDVMGALNNVVRGRPDLLFVWPTTDPSWRDRLVSVARSFGSQSFCPPSGVFAIQGPSRDQWIEAAALMFDQLNSSWDEFGVNESSAAEIAKTQPTLGDFLTAINQIRVAQDDAAENVTGLPQVVFVVSSHSQVVGHVARLRNPRTYRIRSDEVMQSAKKQEVGKFWQARGAAQQQNLAWVSSLLQAKLLSLTPSTIAHACALFCDAESRVRKAVEGTGFRGNIGGGKNAYRKTDLGRFMAGEPVPEVLDSSKGRTSDNTLAAYDAVQSLSSRCHLEINRAILHLAGEASGLFDIDEVQFERPLGADAIVDAIVPTKDRRVHLEFHHLSKKECSPNTIATYMMKKLRIYSYQYNLIDR